MANSTSRSVVTSPYDSEHMQAINKATLERFLLMDRTVDLLIEKAKAKETWPELYDRALDVLEALPLATNDFAVAAQRLGNAFAYCCQAEFGAASFELRVLRGHLSNIG